MKRSFTVCLMVVLVLILAVTEVASAHPRGGSGGWGGGSVYRTPQPLPVWGSRGYRNSWGGNYYGGSWGSYNSNYSSYRYVPVYQPVYTNYSQPATVVVSVPKPRPNIPVVTHDENVLENLATSKFTFVRHLDAKENKVELRIVGRDFHSDTGALKKVKFKVQWVEIKIKKVKGKDGKEVEVREEKPKHTTCKLEFDEFGRFTEFCD